MRVVPHCGFLVGFMYRIFGLSNGILDFAFYLLSNAFYLQWKIVCPLASIALGASHNFVDRTLHPVTIHALNSVYFLVCGFDKGLGSLPSTSFKN